MAQSFSDALNQLLKGAGISGNKLADRIEVDPSQVSRWRNGEGVPKPENIARLAEIFGVERAWLFSLAYPSGDAISSAPDPHWSAFLTEIEAGWRAMDVATRELAERTTRALFSVPPTTQHQRRVTKQPEEFGRPKKEVVHQPRLTRKTYQSQSLATQISKWGLQPAVS